MASKRPSPPYRRLYKHALESIFANLTFIELSRVVVTCREWSAAVHSMRPIGATITVDDITEYHTLHASRLMRHLSDLRFTNVRGLYDEERSNSKIKFIRTLLERSTTITALHVRSHFMRNRIAETFTTSKSIVELHLCDNGIRNVVDIAAFVVQSTTITFIDLATNNIGPDGAIELAGAIATSPSMRSISFSQNEIGPTGVVAIANAIVESKSMTEVNFNHINNIDSTEAAAAIASAIRASKTLTKVHLFAVCFDGNMINEIADALCVSTSMVELEVGRNEISRFAANAIATAIKTSTILTTLGLCFTDIDDYCVCAITDALTYSTSMTSMDLSQNPDIFHVGVAAITRAIYQSKSMITINLGHNEFPPVETAAIGRAVLQSASMREAVLDGNFMDSSNWVDLKLELARTPSKKISTQYMLTNYDHMSD